MRICSSAVDGFFETFASDDGGDSWRAVASDGVMAALAGDAAFSERRWGWNEIAPHLGPPVRPVEVWAAGVTYKRSRDARMEESRDEDVYDRVYRAERPELFLKATGARIVGPGGRIGLRGDATWQVPEPELALIVGPGHAIVGVTLGNDVSSRDIEGENPLYLPQAKVFAGSCALGPVIVSTDEAGDLGAIDIGLAIERDGKCLFAAQTSTTELHVTLETLVEHLARDNWLPGVTALFTGTGIVPPDHVALAPGDVVTVSSSRIGALTNMCAPASELVPPEAWWGG